MNVMGKMAKTVLVVDDNESLRQLAATALEVEGYTVREAQHGLNALEEVERSLPDLILLDLKMPFMSGEEFAGEFRRRYGSSIPIVIMTAADDARERLKATGESHLIQKPFDLFHLLSMVGDLLPL